MTRIACNITGREMHVGQDGMVRFRILDIKEGKVHIEMLEGFPGQPSGRRILWADPAIIDCHILPEGSDHNGQPT